MEKTYQMVTEALQAPFPKGAIEFGQSQNHAYIPVQVYIRRLEDVVPGNWSWTLTAEPNYHENEMAVVVRGELTIMNSTRGGIGVARYVREAASKSITTYKNAISAAESDAIRNACDKFLMGWQDLAPYREWSSNPGVKLSKTNKTEDSIICKKCSKPLSEEDLLFLSVNNIRIPYCLEHVPNHLRKKRAE